MRVGLALPHYDFSFPDGQGLSWGRLVEGAQRAERLGFDSLWISDHFFLDLGRYGGSADPVGTFEPFTALSGLAALTKRARLGVLVASAPFRHPAHVTKMVTTIDLLSGGRFDLGLGAGWYEREFNAFGYPFPPTGDRFRILEESAAVISSLFGDGPVAFDGKTVRISGAYNHPKPAQPSGPPVWIGGKGGDRLLRLVARHATGWNFVWRGTPEAHRGRVDALRRFAERERRDPDTIRLSVGLSTLVGEDQRDVAKRFVALQKWAPGGALDGRTVDEYARDTLTGTPEQCLERLAGFAENGVEELIVGGASLPFAVQDWSMLELVAERLAPEARRL